MGKRSFWVALCLSLLLTLSSSLVFTPLWAADPPTEIEVRAEETDTAREAADEEDKASPEVDFATATQKLEVVDGFLKLYRDRKKNKLLAEIQPDQLNRYYLMATTLGSGVGEFGLYRGMPLQDFPFTLRNVNNTVQVVVPNLYFRSNPDDPLQKFLKDSFSDSVLYSLPIIATHPERQSLLVDVSPLFLREPVALSALMPVLQATGYAPDQEQFYLKGIQNLPHNLELDASYNFKGGSRESWLQFSSLPDSSALTLGVHYSLSQLPWNNGYQPRLADERIGYFITAYRDVSAREQRDPFVRYINRWRLEKAEPSAALSPPKQPIVLWIENTVPQEYRAAFRDGALMWNRAFEKIGFKDAIEVRQMPDNADWDPADIRYNTIRWFDAVEGGFALGPSRVDPFNGQILDGDILVGANLVRYTRQEFDTLHPSAFGQLLWQRLGGKNDDYCPSTFDFQGLREGKQSPRLQTRSEESQFREGDRCLGPLSTQQLAYGSLALSTFQQVLPSSDAAKTYMHQFLSSLIAHEVGHLLGLRHNFQGSTWLSPEELQNPEIVAQKGMVASVMDYVPVNLAPEGGQQGDYFPQRIGPYDEWAIEYGYKPLQDSPLAQRRELEQIASRAAEPGLAYATDEDAMAGVDPRINRFDLSSDLLTYNQTRLTQTRELWEKLNLRGPGVGKSYSDLRQQFDLLLDHYIQNAVVLNNYIGGRQFNRYRAGDAPGQLPLGPVPLEQQRQALQALKTHVFNASAFELPSQLLNKLPSARWYHWGQYPSLEVDYPFYDQILLFQTYMLSDLLSGDRLARLRDDELRQSQRETLTLEELFTTLHDTIWTSTLEGRPQISALQRGLQRQHLAILSNMTLRNKTAAQEAVSLADWLSAMLTMNAPEDARALARSQLQQLRSEVQTAARRTQDRTTLAHCEDIVVRIEKVLNAPLLGS